MEINYQTLVRDFLISLHNSGETEISIKDEDINFYLTFLKGVLSNYNISYDKLTLNIDPDHKLSEVSRFKKLVIKSIIDHKEIGWPDDEHTKIIFDKKPIFRFSYTDIMVNDFKKICNDEKVLIKKEVSGTSLDTNETKTLVIIGRNYNPNLLYK